MCITDSPTVELALALTVTDAETVPPNGLLRLTVGGGVEFETVTDTPADVVCWFNESVAIAVSVWLALEAAVVFQAIEYGLDPVTANPRFTPSNWNCTEVIPTVELALALTVTDPETVPPNGLLRLTVGGGVEFETVTDTPADVVCWFNESVAIAVNVWPALDAVVVFQEIEYGPAPVTADPRFTPSNLNCTELMVAPAVVAAAVADTVTDADTVPPTGFVMLTVGGVFAGPVPEFPKNNPLTTAFKLPVLVTRIWTCPCRFQTKY